MKTEWVTDIWTQMSDPRFTSKHPKSVKLPWHHILINLFGKGQGQGALGGHGGQGGQGGQSGRGGRGGRGGQGGQGKGQFCLKF